MTRPSIKLRPAVTEKMDELPKNESKEIEKEIEQELITSKHDMQLSSEAEKFIKANRYVKQKVGTGFQLDHDLHLEFRIACIREGRDMKDIMAELVTDFLRKHKKRFEK